jgi:hypothetical protein
MKVIDDTKLTREYVEENFDKVTEEERKEIIDQFEKDYVEISLLLDSKGYNKPRAIAFSLTTVILNLSKLGWVNQNIIEFLTSKLSMTVQAEAIIRSKLKDLS